MVARRPRALADGRAPALALFSPASVRFVVRALIRLGAPARDVEDLAQEVFLVAHRKAGQLDPTLRIEPWLCGIARNILREHWRRRRVRPEDLEADGAEILGWVPPAAAEVGALRRAIAGLPDALREPLVLCDLIELTLPEAAAELGVPLDTAKDRLRRARQAIRAALTRDDHGRR